MGVINLAPYKPVPGTVGDANAIANAMTTLEAVINGGIDNNNFAAGLIFNPAKIMQGGAVLNQLLQWGGATWGPGQKITTSTLAGGPPASPADGDIWIATNVDGNGARWTFQYNAGSASAYKWECVGGGDLIIQNDNINQLVNAGDAVSAPNYYSPSNTRYQAVRAGEYEISGLIDFFANGAAMPVYLIGTTYQTATFGGASNEVFTAAGVAIQNNQSVAIPPRIRAAAVGEFIGICGASSANGTVKFAGVSAVYRPRRIA